MIEEVEKHNENEEMFVVLPQTFDIAGELSYKLPDNFKKTHEVEYSSIGKGVKLLTKEEVKAIIKKA